MRSRSPKRASLIVFSGAVLALAVAGTALACTQMLGKITMTGSSLTSGSATYEGAGGDSSNTGYCTTPTRREFATPLPGAPLTFELEVERTSSCKTNSLFPGIYEVRWIEAEDAVAVNTSASDPLCHGLADRLTSDNAWTVLGEMEVHETGTSSGTFALPYNAIDEGPATTAGPGNICLQLVVHEEDDLLGPLNTAPPVIFIKWTVV